MEHYKILKRVASVITFWEELDTLGIWLGCDTNDVTRLRNANHSIKDAAYQILIVDRNVTCNFYFFGEVVNNFSFILFGEDTSLNVGVP